MRNFSRERGPSKYPPRDDFRNRDRDSQRGEMFKATCDECGKQCTVPFKPTSGKPVYCRECFEGKSSDRRDFGGRNERFGNRDDNRSDGMFRAVCAECGEDCMVPFKPSSDKPVFCSSCFEKRGNVSSRGAGNDDIKELKEQIALINSKLDRILAASASKAVVETKKEVKKEAKVVTKAKTKAKAKPKAKKK